MVIAGRELEDLRRQSDAEAERRARAAGLRERPGDPAWWRDRLLKAMSARNPALVTASAYYDGRHPLAFQTDPYRRAFGHLFDGFADNWCGLVVDATEERMDIEGFRIGAKLGEPPAPDVIAVDPEAWGWWQRNEMDAESGVAHTEALIAGSAAALVWWGADGSPEITVEDPETVIVEPEPGNRYRRRAGLKRWMDDDGYGRVTLYLPSAIFKWRSGNKLSGLGTAWADVKTWTPAQDQGDPTWPLANELGVVPLVPLWTNPRARRLGRSEIADVIPLQNATNKLLADLLIASEYAAFRQRWATGIEIPRDENGDPIEIFRAAIDRLWVVEPNRDVGAPGEAMEPPRFGEFAETDLGGYVKAIELVVQHVASQTRTPPHYFYLGGGQPPSGESIKSAETGLVAKSRRRMRHYGEAWEEVVRLAGIIAGRDELRDRTITVETVWSDPESRSESEHVDAVTKMSALGIPQEALWHELGFTATQIERFRAMRAEEVVLTAGLGDLAPPELGGGGAPATEPPVTTPPGS